MIEDLSQVLNESLKSSYIDCINAVALELKENVTQTNSSIESILKVAKNKTLIFKDANKIVAEILSIFEILEKNLHSTRNHFNESWCIWLSKCEYAAVVLPCDSSGFNDDSIIEIDESDENDVQIVNEVKYRDCRKKPNANDNLGKFDSDIEVIENQCDKEVLKSSQNNNSADSESVDNQCYKEVLESSQNNNSADPESVENQCYKEVLESRQNNNSVDPESVENQCYKEVLESRQYNNSTDSESDSQELNQFEKHIHLQKLNFNCFVRLERLSKCLQDQPTSYEENSRIAEEEEFFRMIDLSALEKPSKKRSLSSCDSSFSSTSTVSSKKKLTKKKTKRKKVSVSDNSDISSYYESSDNDGNDYSENVTEFDSFDAQELDDVEEKAKLWLLQDSDTSSDYSDQDDYETSETQRKSPKTKTSKGKKKHIRAAWLKDELLNFKLPDDNTQQKKRDLSSDFSSCSEKETESNESSCSNMDIDREVQSAIIPVRKGRRNIRQVLEDQETTENTRLAVKNEENRRERLLEREKELNDTVSVQECVHDLILDFDPETKKVLVAVDSGLVKLLKPHQKEGVRFMWDCCFESVEQVKRAKGSGCILAHCMGLGKTLQIIALAHTLLANQAAIGVKTLMIVCPMSTILNWIDEFGMWLKHAKRDKNINIVQLTQAKRRDQIVERLNEWQKKGGVLIISYEMFRSFTLSKSKASPVQMEKMRKLLIEPGADLVVCDEGHLLKNEKSKLASGMQQVKTQRRIILTGTPLQNNLNEYHCMVQFVKPHLLGSKAEFANRFGNPIANGQFDNSTPADVRLMKHRAHVLHRLLEGCVQRRDYAVLTPFLPPKQEYVISVCLSDLQTQMYQRYISDMNIASHCSLFKNYQEIKRLVAHPKTMQLKATRGKVDDKDFWWRELVEEQDLDDISKSNKLLLLFNLLDVCAKEQDKVLVFSQCLFTLDLIEVFLKKASSSEGSAKWQRGLDYFRLDGKVSSKDRSNMCRAFNDPANPRLRLFLISTKAGGLGINLTGANRVVVFDPSWNPSNDLQSIFRVFRFGQKKPCYVYRFLTAGTMEEKIYNRQVNKLSLSLRVVDEQQVGRHYRDSDLMELYKLEPLPERTAVLAKPSDRVLAEVIDKHGQLVYNYFEHDSLLEDQEEEKLDEQERQQAWLDYQHLEKQAQPEVKQEKTTEQEGSASTAVDSF